VPPDDDAQVHAPSEVRTVVPPATPAPVRTVWDWMQIVGLLLLAAGVAVLVVFALTLGGR
jgi:hypothetical protein